MTRSFDRAVQIFPLTFDFDSGFVHPPATTHSTFMPAKHFIHQGGQADSPKVKRGMSNENSTLGHPLLEITQAKGTGKVPPNTLSNNIDGIMRAFNSISDQRRGQATLQKNSMLPDNALKQQNRQSHIIWF